MDRTELADFLRRSRARLQPADVGLAPGRRRRTPGLRREEVAQVAGMSVDYLTRLEQGRGPHPSPQLLAALARALRLTDDERDHLSLLSGQQPPERHGRTGHVRPALLHLLDRLDDAAAFVVSDIGEYLAQNALAVALVGDQTGRSGREASAVWRWFTDPAARGVHPAEDHDHHSRIMVADLRAAAARRRGDDDVEDLVRGLRATSAEFAALWEQHEVAVRRADRKRFVHAEVGVVEVDCEVLLTPEHGQGLVLLTARPGTAAREQLQLLRVLGTQDLLRAEPGALRA